MALLDARPAVRLAAELPEPDCPPVRVPVLGEQRAAFRDTRDGIDRLEELCPHRLASLSFGRNEECGLRCVYQCGKYDVAGRCVDLPNEPADPIPSDAECSRLFPQHPHPHGRAVRLRKLGGPPDSRTGVQ